MSAERSAQFTLDPEDAAEDALAALRRQRLVHSWQATEQGTYDVLVGRGTVGAMPLDPAGVLTLAAMLRRDRVSLSGRGYPMGYRTTRYDLSDGRFLDRYDSRVGRYLDDLPYTAYVPGGDPSGSAAVSFAARTRVEALALAGLARVRGRCTRCQQMRPLALHQDHWRPAPMIRCPGCDADTTTAITLLCDLCREPIVGNTHQGSGFLSSAWRHVATGRSHCDTTDHRWPGIRREAQLL